MSLSLSEHLILGILAEQPHHGYDIEKVITERGMRKWADIGFSSIYYILDKLESKQLVKSSASQGKEKKQFSITPKGSAVLKDETKKLIANRNPANMHIMTGLASSDLVESADLEDALRQRKTQLSSDLDALQAAQSLAKNVPRSAQQLFSLSETLLKSELHWINEELERMTV